MSDEPAPATVTSTAAGTILRRAGFFRGGTLTSKRAALPKRESLAELRFRQPGDRQVEIIAAQQKMPADVRARELDAVAFAIHTNKGEVARAAAHIANQNQLAVEQFFVRSRKVGRDPRIECRGGLFEQ